MPQTNWKLSLDGESATLLGAENDVSVHTDCVDATIQWREVGQVGYSAALTSGFGFGFVKDVAEGTECYAE